MGFKRMALLLVSGVLLAGALAAPVMAHSTTVYSGNMCGNVYGGPKWWIDHSGSEACIERGGYAAGRYFYIAPIAFDYYSNGRSALNDWRVWQQVSGTWRVYKSSSCFVSAGYGYSNVCGQILVSRLSGANRVAIQMRSCNYESTTGIRIGCSSYEYKTNAAW